MTIDTKLTLFTGWDLIFKLLLKKNLINFKKRKPPGYDPESISKQC